MTDFVSGLGSMRELTALECEMVAGGVAGTSALVLPNGNINENANSPNTPAAGNGLSPPKAHGAFVSNVGTC